MSVWSKQVPSWKFWSGTAGNLPLLLLNCQDRRLSGADVKFSVTSNLRNNKFIHRETDRGKGGLTAYSFNSHAFDFRSLANWAYGSIAFKCLKPMLFVCCSLQSPGWYTLFCWWLLYHKFRIPYISPWWLMTIYPCRALVWVSWALNAACIWSHSPPMCLSHHL